MRFFRSTWLTRIAVFPLLALLNVGPFGITEQQGDGEGELVIHATQFLTKLSASLQQPKIKYGFDVVHVSVVTIFKKIISDDYILRTSFDPRSIDLRNSPSRGPPRLITIL